MIETFDLLIIDILGNHNVVKCVVDWGLHTDDVFYRLQMYFS